MRAFAIWLALTVTAFAGAGGAYPAYLTSHPRLVAIVIDTSYEMRSVLSVAANTASALAADARYSEIAYFSDKAQLSDYLPKARVPPLSAYGPRQLNKLSDGTLANQLVDAQRIIFISNAPAAERARLPGHWQQITL